LFVNGTSVHGRRSGHPAFTTARFGLRAYRGTAVLLAGVGTAVLAAGLILARVTAWNGHTPVSTLGIATVRATTLGAGTSRSVMPPAGVQRDAIDTIFPVVLMVGALALAVGGITVLTLSNARAEDRRVEMAVRRAVGASRTTLIQALSLEGGTVGAAALLAGGLVGLGAGGLAVSTWPGTATLPAPISALLVIGYVLAGIAIGSLLPLHFARGRNVPQAFDQPHGLLGPTLQLGLCLTVLAAAGLIGRYAGGLMKAAPPSAASGAVYQITAPAAADSVRAQEYSALLRRLGGEGTGSVTLTSPGTLLGLGTVDGIMTQCGNCYLGGIYSQFHRIRATHQVVSADTFTALGARIVEGRGILATDRFGGQPVAVVNQEMAYRHFEGGQAVGHEIYLGPGFGEPHMVVGIVADPPRAGFGVAQQPPNTVYLSILQHPVPETELVVRLPADPDAVPGALGVLGVSLGQVTRTSEAALLAREAAPMRWFSRWLGVEGWVMLLLAAVGTFATMRLWVLSLLPELGIRRALGARRRHLLGLVAAGAASVGGRGIVVGVAGGWVIWGSMGVFVHDLPSFDPELVAELGALLALVAVAGAMPAAWGAVRERPAVLMGARE
jgi:putative ABC transport system permease protein